MEAGDLAVAARRKVERKLLSYLEFWEGSSSKYTRLILVNASIAGIRNLGRCGIVHNIALGNIPASRRSCSWLAGTRGNGSR